MLRSTLLTDYSYPSNSISKATPPCTATPTSACSILAGMRSVPPVISQQHPGSSGSKGLLSGRLRPLSLPKPTIILPFSHSKTMTILKDGHMKPVPLQYCMYIIIIQQQHLSPLPAPPPPFKPKSPYKGTSVLRSPSYINVLSDNNTVRPRTRM